MTEKKRLPLSEHFLSLIENPVSIKEFDEKYTHEFWFPMEFLLDLMYLVYLHKAELDRLKKKLEVAEK